MAGAPDLLIAVNLLLCIVILILGILVYRKQEVYSGLLTGIAFGMFGISDLATLAGIGGVPEGTLLLLRVCGCLLVAAALWLLFAE